MLDSVKWWIEDHRVLAAVLGCLLLLVVGFSAFFLTRGDGAETPDLAASPVASPPALVNGEVSPACAAATEPLSEPPGTPVSYAEVEAAVTAIKEACSDPADRDLLRPELLPSLLIAPPAENERREAPSPACRERAVDLRQPAIAGTLKGSDLDAFIAECGSFPPLERPFAASLVQQLR